MIRYQILQNDLSASRLAFPPDTEFCLIRQSAPENIFIILLILKILFPAPAPRAFIENFPGSAIHDRLAMRSFINFPPAELIQLPFPVYPIEHPFFHITAADNGTEHFLLFRFFILHRNTYLFPAEFPLFCIPKIHAAIIRVIFPIRIPYFQIRKSIKIQIIKSQAHHMSYRYFTGKFLHGIPCPVPHANPENAILPVFFPASLPGVHCRHRISLLFLQKLCAVLFAGSYPFDFLFASLFLFINPAARPGRKNNSFLPSRRRVIYRCQTQ